MDWYLDVWRKYAVFSGRARRKEYWYFLLFNIIVSAVLGLVDGLAGTANQALGLGLLSLLYTLAVLMPSVAVTVRRLHDSDRSAWWLLISFIPIIGPIVLFVLMLLGGSAGPNRFGADPRDEAV